MKNASFLRSVERGALSLFLGCMVTTATLMVIFLWTQPEQEAPFMVAMTFFIIGLASFLTWLPTMLYRVLDK